MPSHSEPVEEPKKISRFEAIIAGILFGYQMVGAFSPVDEYFAPSVVHNIYNAIYGVPTTYAINSILHMIGLTVLFVLTVMNFRGMLRQVRLMLPLVALLSWITASSLWSIDPYKTLHHALHMVDHVVFSMYLVYRFTWREMIVFLTRCSAVLMVLSFVMIFVFSTYGYSDLNGYSDAWRGIFTQKNSLGASAGVGILITSYSCIMGWNRRWFAAAVCLGEVVLLVGSHSATSLILVVLGVGVFVMAMGITRHHHRTVRAVALAAMAAGFIVAVFLFARFDTVNEMLGRSEDMTGRLEIWHFVKEAIALKPWFGYGYGFWDMNSLVRMNLWESVGWNMPHAHNEYLDVTLQLGVIGLALELFCLGLALLRAMRLSFTLGDGRALLCGIMVMMLCVRGYSETVLTDPAINGWPWLIMATLVLAREAKARKPAPAVWQLAL